MDGVCAGSNLSWKLRSAYKLGQRDCELDMNLDMDQILDQLYGKYQNQFVINFTSQGKRDVVFLFSGHDLACQQEISLVLAKTPPIHY